MEKKMMAWKTKGMNQDLSVSAFNPEFSFENMNLRLATNDGNTMLSWVNEKGTKRLTLSIYNSASNNIIGVPIGTAIINNKLVVFTAGESGSGYIYVFSNTPLAGGQGNADLYGKLLYSDPDSSNGILGFSAEHPFETLVSYESEDVQKVYWTDGDHQPRMVNIAASDDSIEKWNSTSFDFVQDLKLEEEIKVKKECGNGGSFPSGVIQYAFTYYQKFGQESNIFYTTPLLYVSPSDRGARPDEVVDNTFTISVKHVDENFDYLRIYSIQRTSVNSTPIVKRVQDLKISEMERVTDDNPPTEQSIYYRKTSYTDTGLNGDTVDPTELLYKGGESIVAKTIEQKDGTLFLGNLRIERPHVDIDMNAGDVTLKSDNTSETKRTFYPNSVTTGNYPYSSQLTAYDSSMHTVPCAGFKYGDYYRCGVQFQYKTGKWSDPIFVGDRNIEGKPSYNNSNNTISVPVIKGTLTLSKAEELYNDGYRKVRAVVVYPNVLDRVVVCQGISNKAIGKYTSDANDSYGINSYQSSWFFRPIYSGTNSGNGTTTPAFSGRLHYKSNAIDDNPNNIRAVEIQGHFDYVENGVKNQFEICDDYATFHSPDVEFEDYFHTLTMPNVKFRNIAKAAFTHTLSDIDIQTETPTISSDGRGFIHKSFDVTKSFGIISGPFYEDYILDDYDYTKVGKMGGEQSPVGWMVYPWQRNGSLNNDIERPAGGGVRSALLKKKVISNYRYAATIWNSNNTLYDFIISPQLFSSNEVEILKLGEKLYQGNIDTMLNPDKSDGLYFNFDGDNGQNPKTSGVNTPFTENDWWKTFTYSDEGEETVKGDLYRWENTAEPEEEEDWKWNRKNIQEIGDDFKDLIWGKYSVRMKYKSTPHLILNSNAKVSGTDDIALTNASVSTDESALPILEIVRPGNTAQNYYRAEMFGGTSQDALKANTWIPCGEPVRLDDTKEVLIDGVSTEVVQFEYSWGDTYYQRWDCMKTYPFTNEDPNQIIEIGSFMLETHVNIDGRYDRNRGQLTNVSPINFNLLNPVYGQLNNFFSYKILDADDYNRIVYPNQITWTKAKESGADVDLWTDITLASTLELDGDKGGLNKLIRLNDSLLAFQDTGISQVLYNENVQIQSTEGVPIELANSGKVQGKRYISNTIGCSNKWSMATTPLGIYFIDSHEDSIYLFNGELNNLSMKNGMNSAIKRLNPPTNVDWNPLNFRNIVTYYDKKNQDVLFFNGTSALAYSEKIGTFTSFYSYKGGVYLCDLEGRGIWIGLDETPQTTGYYFWGHQEGDYCKFFNKVYPYWMILVGNPEPLLDKTFTNLEFRACVTGDGSTKTEDEQVVFNNFYLPFDSLEVWDEYQHGLANLSIKNGGMGDGKHHLPVNSTASLNRKFRIWRCDIPRDNASVNPSTEASMGITRFKIRPLDRMRNPWVYLKLMKNVEEGQNGQLPMHKVEIHDMVMSYFI